MSLRTAVLLILVVLAVAALVGCGGSPDLPGTDNAPTAGPDASLTCLATSDLLAREAPADVDTENAVKGGIDGPLTSYSEPQIWGKGKWTSLKPYCGKRRFVGPAGVYRFVLSGSLGQASAKGGIPAYAVYDQLPMRVRPESENAWQLYSGYYTIKSPESTSFSLEVVSAPTTGPLMRCGAIDPDRGVEYARGAYGRYLVDIGSRVLLLPAWYNRTTGRRVAPPAGALQASAWGDSSFLVSAGTQMFVVAGYPAVFSAGLSVSPKVGGMGGGDEYWYSTIRLDSRGRG